MKDTIPAPIVLAIAGGGVPLVKALLDSANLAIAVGIAVFGAALCYFVSLYLLGKMGLPATASLLDVSAARKKAKAKRP